jgi:hypothetical protein
MACRGTALLVLIIDVHIKSITVCMYVLARERLCVCVWGGDYAYRTEQYVSLIIDFELIERLFSLMYSRFTKHFQETNYFAKWRSWL